MILINYALSLYLKTQTIAETERKISHKSSENSGTLRVEHNI